VSTASTDAPINVFISVDGGAYIELGSITSGSESIPIPPFSGKRFRLKLVINAKDNKTPTVVSGYAIDASISPTKYRQWSFQAELPMGYGIDVGPQHSVDPYSFVSRMLDKANNLSPVLFGDVDGSEWNGRVLSVEAMEREYDAARGPSVVLRVSIIGISRLSSLSKTLSVSGSSFFLPSGALFGRQPVKGSGSNVSAFLSVQGPGSLVVSVLGNGEAYRRVVVTNMTTDEFIGISYPHGFAGKTEIFVDKDAPSIKADGEDITSKADPGTTFWSVGDDKVVVIKISAEHISSSLSVQATPRGVSILSLT
jgi:hypothetical protein